MSAIVVLTRGYTNFYYYDILINRNKSIEANLVDKTIDIIIFNEGNIHETDQEYIMEQTPTLKIKFVDICEHSFKKEKEQLQIKDTYRCHFGYRHMCHFWFVDFWKYVEQYDKILRIDEDCIIFSNIDTIFEGLNSKVALYGRWEPDEEFVTLGLNKFTLDFLKDNNISTENSRQPSGPYTNLIAFNLKELRNSSILHKYIKSIEQSGNIYKFRWGDLATWGEALFYLFDNNQHQMSLQIKYHHYVNGTPVIVN
jgi:lipopolysaccharide biosynthesis glycosyltransferase